MFHFLWAFLSQVRLTCKIKHSTLYSDIEKLHSFGFRINKWQIGDKTPLLNDLVLFIYPGWIFRTGILNKKSNFHILGKKWGFKIRDQLLNLDHKFGAGDTTEMFYLSPIWGMVQVQSLGCLYELLHPIRDFNLFVFK